MAQGIHLSKIIFFNYLRFFSCLVLKVHAKKVGDAGATGVKPAVRTARRKKGAGQ
jgi:hypothetical protein